MTQLLHRIAQTLSGVRLGHRIRRARFRSDCDLEVGRNVHIGRNVSFRGRRVRIGDGTVIRDNVTVEADVFEIGDYGTIYPDCFFPGPGEIRIGHNFWLGNGSIVDAMGGTSIGNNVGVGAASQLWTHMEFGDVMAGCRFHSARPLVIEDDAWLVGHCLVSPVRVGARSLAMLGSLVTKDMEPDRCYAGTPAADITEKIGSQFEATTLAQRREYLSRELDAFAAAHGGRDRFVVVDSAAERGGQPTNQTVFRLGEQTYRKIGTQLEHWCMRWLLPEAKFTPAP